MAKKKKKKIRYADPAVPQLEGLLGQWEHYWAWIRRMRLIWEKRKLRRPFPWTSNSALDNSARFRDYVLSIHQQDPDLENIGQFDWPTPLTEEAKNDSLSVGGLALVPRELARWNLCSRRVYRVPRDLQAILCATDFGDLRWNDVELPHESYAIELEQPLRIAGGDTSSLLLLSRFDAQEQDEATFVIRSVADSSGAFRRNDYGSQEQFTRLFDRNEFDRAMDVTIEQTARVRVKGLTFVIPECSGNEKIQDTLDDLLGATDLEIIHDNQIATEDDIEVTKLSGNLASRILIGVALYFQTLPSDASRSSGWRRISPQGHPNPRAITNRAQLFDVHCRYRLTDLERAFLGLGDGTGISAPGWKFVRGYWRRPQGLGRDPTASKTKHVRPYMRGRQSMPEDRGLPGGASQGMEG